MNTSIKVILVAFSILTIIAGVIYWSFFKAGDNINMNPKEKNYVIDFEGSNSKLYVKAKSWVYQEITRKYFYPPFLLIKTNHILMMNVLFFTKNIAIPMSSGVSDYTHTYKNADLIYHVK